MKHKYRKWSELSDDSRALLAARFAGFGVRWRVEEEVDGTFYADKVRLVDGGTLTFENDAPLIDILHDAGHAVALLRHAPGALAEIPAGDVDHALTSIGLPYSPDDEMIACAMQVYLARDLPEYGEDQTLEEMDRDGYFFGNHSAAQWYRVVGWLEEEQ